MNRHKWYSTILMILTLVCTSSVAACSEPVEVGSEIDNHASDLTLQAIDDNSPTLSEPSEVGTEIGKRAPDFTLQTINGTSLTLSDFGDKMVMVNFWLIDCKGCVDELPYIQAVFDEWPSDELVVLAINVGDSSTAVHALVDGQGFTFPVLLDLGGEVCMDYGRGAPTTFFIDGNGIIRAIKDGIFQSPDEIESMVDSLQST